MSKAVLKYGLPEESEDFLLAVHGRDFFSVLWDVDQFLREALKHGHNFKTADEALEKTREELRELMYAYNVSLDMIQ